MTTRSRHILPLIVVSQFAGTSLWFAGNAILPELQLEFDLGKQALGNITSSVQLGFITGTLLFAILSVADRFSPSRVFFFSSLLAALSNTSMIWLAKDGFSIIALRFLTGFFLAGIYPVGMKIAADWYQKGLGKALGWLVGALVLGTALPHLLRGVSLQFSWKDVAAVTSLFAATGGLIVLLFIKDGPYRKQGAVFHPGNLLTAFRSKDFRSAAFGYFGHMWELYTFWAFVPVLLTLNSMATGQTINISLWSFIIISSGFISCVVGGYVARWLGSSWVAFWSLMISGACCLLSFLLLKAPTPVFLLFLMIWGLSVVSDSPQFSAMVAQAAPAEIKGTALTITTCIGFSITIVSIQLFDWLFNQLLKPGMVFPLLGAGPLIGLLFLFRSLKTKNT